MIRKYGIEFPNNTSSATIELGCYRIGGTENIDPVNGLPAWKHLYNAACILLPDNIYGKHYWVAKRFKAWCSHGFQTWIGPGAVAKSTDAGVIALLHWLSAPDRTTVIVCSTTKDMLEKRIFGEIVKYYKKIPNAPGEYKRSNYAITLGDENSKNGIFGIAILKGTVKEAMGNIVGIHYAYNVLIIDEMQATRAAAVEAVNNLSASGEEFKFLGMGNPESSLDPLGRYSIPVGGWETISPDTHDFWETRYGGCYFFDGYKSPAIVEPNGEKKYPYLLSQKEIDQAKIWYGEDSPQFWSQRRGFFPPEGIEKTVFSEALLANKGAYNKSVWGTSYTPIAGLDPSFSTGGDRCVLYFARVGNDVSGLFVIEFTDMIVIKPKVSLHETITEQITTQVYDECHSRGVTADLLGVDCSGTQVSLADALQKRFGASPYRVQFGGKASDRNISILENVPGNKRYYNRVTELWYTLFQYVSFGQVKGMSSDLATELCSRRLGDKVFPVQIESKTVMKTRTNSSPDIADAAVIVAAVAKEVLQYMPGVGVADKNGDSTKLLEDRLFLEYDIDTTYSDTLLY